MFKLKRSPGAMYLLKHQLEKALMLRTDYMLDELANKCADSIKHIGGDKLELTITKAKGARTISAYGQTAVAIENDKHPFKITHDMVPNIIKEIGW